MRINIYDAFFIKELNSTIYRKDYNITNVSFSLGTLYYRINKNIYCEIFANNQNISTNNINIYYFIVEMSKQHEVKLS